MKFRDQEFDRTVVIDRRTSDDFTRDISILADQYVIIDMQYNVRVECNKPIYSALILLKIKG